MHTCIIRFTVSSNEAGKWTSDILWWDRNKKIHRIYFILCFCVLLKINIHITSIISYILLDYYFEYIIYFLLMNSNNISLIYFSKFLKKAMCFLIFINDEYVSFKNCNIFIVYYHSPHAVWYNDTGSFNNSKKTSWK